MGRVMRIRVQCYGNVRDVVNERFVDIQCDAEGTVADLLERLEDDYPDLRDLRTHQELIVMRDRRHLDLDSSVNDGDVVNLSTSPMPE